MCAVGGISYLHWFEMFLFGGKSYRYTSPNFWGVRTWNTKKQVRKLLLGIPLPFYPMMGGKVHPLKHRFF
jgi:hypothetical protein